LFSDKPGVISSGLSNSETKNAACKSNMTEMIVGDCDIPETKSQQNVHTKENHRQRQKHPNNDALNQNSQSGNEAPNKYKSKFCSYIVACLRSIHCFCPLGSLHLLHLLNLGHLIFSGEKILLDGRSMGDPYGSPR
jgi:hypothetical protein